MIRRLKILILFLLLSWLSFSQKDTSKICFDYTTAQRIAIDLVRGDSAIAELQQVHQKNITLQKLIEDQQKILDLCEEKHFMCSSQVITYENIVVKHEEFIKDLEKDVEELTQKNTNLKRGLKWMGGGLIGTLSALTLLILIK